MAATATMSKQNKFRMALLGPCKVGQLMRPRTNSCSASSPLTLLGRVVALSSIGVSTYDICKTFAYATPLPHLSGCIHDHVTYHHCCLYSTTSIECGRHLWKSPSRSVSRSSRRRPSVGGARRGSAGRAPQPFLYPSPSAASAAAAARAPHDQPRSRLSASAGARSSVPAVIANHCDWLSVVRHQNS